MLLVWPSLTLAEGGTTHGYASCSSQHTQTRFGHQKHCLTDIVKAQDFQCLRGSMLCAAFDSPRRCVFVVSTTCFFRLAPKRPTPVLSRFDWTRLSEGVDVRMVWSRSRGSKVEERPGLPGQDSITYAFRKSLHRAAGGKGQCTVPRAGDDQTK